MKMKDLKNTILYQLQNKENKIRLSENDEKEKRFVFVMANGSDSVKLIYSYNDGLDNWSIEIFPTNANKSIIEYQFSNMNDVVKAFQVWISYYELVVKENCKMF